MASSSATRDASDLDTAVRVTHLGLYGDLTARPFAWLTLHAGGRLDMADIYDNASIRIVERLYAADIERFGYTFGETAGPTVQPIRHAA